MRELCDITLYTMWNMRELCDIITLYTMWNMRELCDITLYTMWNSCITLYHIVVYYIILYSGSGG